jgi:hypothetical protein
MYRTAAIVAFLTVLAIITVDLGDCAILFRRRLHVAPVARVPSGFLRLSRIAVNTLALGFFAAAAASGFLAVFQQPGTLSGYGLLFHVAAATGFAVSVVALALFWIERNRFTGSEWRTSRHLALRKIFFWVALALALPTIASIILAMLPLPTPSQQEWLFGVHRCCALALVTAGSLFTWFGLMSWRDRTGD